MSTRTPALVRFLALSLGLAACTSTRDTAARPDTTAATAATRVDKQAEEQKIRALEGRWREALTAKDSAAVGGFYADEGFYLPQGSNGYQGQDKIGSRWASEFTGGKFELQREPKKVEVADAGDMAYEVGTYKVSWESLASARRVRVPATTSRCGGRKTGSGRPPRTYGTVASSGESSQPSQARAVQKRSSFSRPQARVTPTWNRW